MNEDPLFRSIEKKYRIQKKKAKRGEIKKFVPVFPPLDDVINSFNDRAICSEQDPMIDNKDTSLKEKEDEYIDHNSNYRLDLDTRVCRLPNLTLHEGSNQDLNNEVKSTLGGSNTMDSCSFYLCNRECEVFSFPEKPGLYLLRNILDYEAQIYWGLRCVRDFSRSNYTNIINLKQLQEENEKKQEKEAKEEGKEGDQKQLKEHFNVKNQDQDNVLSKVSSLQESKSLNHDGYSSISTSDIDKEYIDVGNAKRSEKPTKNINNDISEDIDSRREFSSVDLMSQLSGLRWANLGYSYNWTKRLYMKSTYPINNDDKRPAISNSVNFEEEPIIETETLLPHDLTLLLKEIVKGLNLEMDPEAAIINYYPLSTTMGGHVDDAEGELTNPIISFSLGCSAIFIIGGETKENGPVYPILVRSGDCLVMSGNSRRFFHAVPCIYPGTFSLGQKIKGIQCKENVEELHSSDIVNQIRRNIQVSEEDNSPDKAKEEKILSGESEIGKRVKIDVTVSEVMQIIDFLSIHRINFNARQVVPFGKSLKDVLDEKKEYKPYDGGRV